MDDKYLKKQLALLEIKESSPEESAPGECGADSSKAQNISINAVTGKGAKSTSAQDALSIPIWREAIKEAIMFAPISLEMRLALSVNSDRN